jgi:hypothetical protein
MFTTVADVDDFKGKFVSLKLVILLIALTAIATWTGAEIYFHFRLMEKDLVAQQALHLKDVTHMEEMISYERDRIDRKFKRLEEND